MPKTSSAATKNNLKQFLLLSIVLLSLVACQSDDGASLSTASKHIENQKNVNPQAETKLAHTEITESKLGIHFFALLGSADPDQAHKSLQIIKDHWHAGLIPMAVEVLLFARPGGIQDELIDLVKVSLGKADQQSENLRDLYTWAWNQNIKPATEYADFKADLYRNIDERFDRYFRGRANTSQIRLDEIRWGGVTQNGIPPLRSPRMVSAEKASYLDDDNIVFGIQINGDVRAYPKRILAWHEMFTDTIGGVEIVGVYCTLCGTVIPYRNKHQGVSHKLGTSGFLYRSNKLMYDEATQSLWSTTKGTPVLGPLADKNIELEFESVVTTTWGEWRQRHPQTQVLSLDTGHQRDYGEGVAYAEYFSTDQLMFHTPFDDNRLANKREILALRFPAAPDQQLAIDTQYLNENRLYKGKIGQQRFIVITDKTGANRVFDPMNINFIAPN